MRVRTLARAVLPLAICLLASACVKRAPTQDAPQAPTAAAQEAPPLPPLVTDPRAMDLLKAMSERLAAARTMSFTALSSHEYPSQFGPPVEYAMRYDVWLKRPGTLKVVIPGDGPASEFYTDGKRMMAYVPAENLVAEVPAPPTIDESLKQVYQAADVYFPFCDLIQTDPYTVLSQGTKLAFVIGRSVVVGGTVTDVVAWSSDDVFLQVWIGSRDKLPRKYRAVFLDDPLLLRHEVELTGWKLDNVPASDLAPPHVPANARRIEFARPAGWPAPGGAPGAKAPAGQPTTNQGGVTP